MHHCELAFRFVASANIFKDKDVAADGAFGKLRANVIRIVVADSVGSAIQDKWKRSIRVSGAKNNGEKFYAVAHGNHDLLAGIGTKIIRDRMIADSFCQP